MIARSIIILVIIFINVGLDQITKVIARNNIDYNENIVVIKNFLTLTKVENFGAFLSLGNSLSDPLRFLLLSIVPSLFLLYGIYYLITNKEFDWNIRWAGSFILGGGIGNLYDRIVYGSVTDFLHMDFYLFETGIFNIADVSIMIGGFLVLISLLKKNKKQGSAS